MARCMILEASMMSLEIPAVAMIHDKSVKVGAAESIMIVVEREPMQHHAVEQARRCLFVLVVDSRLLGLPSSTTWTTMNLPKILALDR